MRILHVVPSYRPAWRYGGPIRSVHALALAQAAAGESVEVATTDADGSGRLAVPSDRPVMVDELTVRYHARSRPRRIFRAPSLRRDLERRIREFDLLHLHSVFLWPTLAAARIAERAQVPYLVSPRGILDRDLLRQRGWLRKLAWIRAFERRTLARAAAIHATSEFEHETIRELGLWLAPFGFVLPNGVSPPDDESSSGPESEARADAARGRGPYLLYVGRLARKKSIELLVEAVARVEGLRLIVVGNDEEGVRSRLAQLGSRLGMDGRLDFVGEVRGPAKWRLLAGSLALGLASRSENFGNVVPESLLAGRPVVVSSGVGSADIVMAARCGLVTAASVEAIERAVRELYEQPEIADQMGRRGREYVESELTWARIADRMREHYERCLGARG